MSFRIEAPYPGWIATTILPDPQLGDNESLKNRLDIHRSMTGLRRTYINSSGRTSLTYNFKITRPKALELEEFIKAYNAKPWKITNYAGLVWIVNLMNNPFEFISVAKSSPGRETLNVRLELEGTLL